MSFSPEQIQKVAGLARLKITPEEEERYAGQLSAIIDYVEQLKSIPQAPESVEIEALNHSQDELRLDQADGGRFQKDIIAQAPEHQDNFISVPAVFGGEE